MSSRAAGRSIIGSIVTPSMRASGLAARAASITSRAACSAAAGLVRPSRTPPTSLLCWMSGERIFTTTALCSLRMRRAHSAVSSGVSAGSIAATGIW